MLSRIFGALIGFCLTVASPLASPQHDRELQLLTELASRELIRCQDELAKLREYVHAIVEQSEATKETAASAVANAEAQCEKLKRAIEQATQPAAGSPHNPSAPQHTSSAEPQRLALPLANIAQKAQGRGDTSAQSPGSASGLSNPTCNKTIVSGRSPASCATGHISSNVRSKTPISHDDRSTAVANPHSAMGYLLVAQKHVQMGEIREASDALETAERHALNNNAAYEPGQDPARTPLIQRIEGARAALRENDRSGASSLIALAISGSAPSTHDVNMKRAKGQFGFPGR